MIWTIAKREIVTRLRSKGYRISTALLFLGVFGLALAVALTSGGDGPRTVTIGVSGAGVDYVDALEVGTDVLDPTIVITDQGTALLDDGSIGVLFTGDALTWSGFPDSEIDLYVRSTVQQSQFSKRALDLELDPSDVAALLAPLPIEEVRLDGGDENFGVRFAAAGVAGLATFMLLQIWGSFTLMGVVEEKSSRVVEVLLSHVRPVTLLSGKIIGLGVLAMTQMLIFVAGLAVGLLVARDITIPTDVWSTVPLLALTFLLGYGFYATAFAAVGSMISRQEDAQTAQLPAMFPLFVGYLIAATSIGNSDNIAVRIGSYVPFTSPVLLPFRNAFTPLPLWELTLSLVILAVSTVIMLRVGGWIYRFSLLRIGSRVTWSDLWRNRRDATL